MVKTWMFAISVLLLAILAIPGLFIKGSGVVKGLEWGRECNHFASFVTGAKILLKTTLFSINKCSDLKLQEY